LEKAVIVSWSAVSDEVMVTEHVPLAPVVQLVALKVASPLVMKLSTNAPWTGVPPESFTVAVAVDVEVLSAGIELGLRASETCAGAANSVSVAVPDFVSTVAVIVSWSAVEDAWIGFEQTPSMVPGLFWLSPVVQVFPLGKVTSPLVLNVAVAPFTGLPAASFAVTVAVVDELPLAAIDDGLTATVVTAETVSVSIAEPE
jgi:hypothetical protein